MRAEPPTHSDGPRKEKRKQQHRRDKRDVSRLGRARQAGRHDVDACGRGHPPPVHGEARRPRRHARSARVRLSADCARRGDQDRSLHHGLGKTYRFTIRWGEETRHRRSRRPGGRAERRPTDRTQIEALLPAFTGVIEQVPPQLFRHQGRRRARLRPRPRRRDGRSEAARGRYRPLELVDSPDPDHSVFETDCGKGTYVRALARDMGRFWAVWAMFRSCGGPRWALSAKRK